MVTAVHVSPCGHVHEKKTLCVFQMETLNTLYLLCGYRGYVSITGDLRLEFVNFTYYKMTVHYVDMPL